MVGRGVEGTRLRDRTYVQPRLTWMDVDVSCAASLPTTTSSHLAISSCIVVHQHIEQLPCEAKLYTKNHPNVRMLESSPKQHVESS
ncbi:hypothetical protein PENSPDRAFT_184355 [Peniophora sp. CONT]|nr:hypothetical protein PENSPDRAFT_184355 [Peniophora sp. CONT]